MTDVAAAVEEAYRSEWGQVVATMIGVTGNWDVAEDCAQEAFTAALTAWARDGVPRRPGAWLTVTARNRATDRQRRDAVGEAKLRQLAALPPASGDPAPDEEIPAGLSLVDELEASGALEGYHLLPATRADLLRRDGRPAEARASYERALALAPTESDRRYLSGRLRELGPQN